MATRQSDERRRRTRLPHNLSVILSGVDANGLNFAEETETVSVGKQGAAVRTACHLRMGQELSMRTKEKNRVGQFQVVWMGKKGTPSEGKVGIEFVEPRIFWGVQFAPEDWGKD